MQNHTLCARVLTCCLGPCQGLTVEPQTILDVSGAVPEAAVDALMKACRSNSFAEVQQAITNSIADGFPVCIAATCCHVCVGLIWLCNALSTISCFVVALCVYACCMMCTSGHSCVAIGCSMAAPCLLCAEALCVRHCLFLIRLLLHQPSALCCCLHTANKLLQRQKLTQAIVLAGPADTIRVAECSVARPRTEGPAKGESLPGVG